MDSEIINEKIIQIIAGSNEFERETVETIIESIEPKGYNCFIVSVEKFSNSDNLQWLNESLDNNSQITIIISGIRWDSISKKVNPKMLPNTIVITANPTLQFYWDIKPSAIMQYNIENNLLLAIQDLIKKSVSYPARSVSFQTSEFGWIRKQFLNEPFVINAWKALLKNVWPGYKFPIISDYKGNEEKKFEVVDITEESITIKSPTAIHPLKVPKNDFCKLAIVWIDYKYGYIQRHELRSKSRYSDYIIGILHWLDTEGHLSLDKIEY